jgi:hypothetical protein
LTKGERAALSSAIIYGVLSGALRVIMEVT